MTSPLKLAQDTKNDKQPGNLGGHKVSRYSLSSRQLKEYRQWMSKQELVWKSADRRKNREPLGESGWQVKRIGGCE